VHLLVSEQYIDSLMNGATIEDIIPYLYLQPYSWWWILRFETSRRYRKT